MKKSEIECDRINTKPHYQNKTRASALNHVFTCTQCTVPYVQVHVYKPQQHGIKQPRRKGGKSELKFKVGFSKS